MQWQEEDLDSFLKLSWSLMNKLLVTLTCSNSIIEILEKGVDYVQS